ncbi:glycosyltransferase [Sphingomonas sp. CJ20]
MSNLDMRAVELTVCIYLDGCEDDSAALLRKASGVLPCPLRVGGGLQRGTANAGVARHAAMAMGLAALPDGEGLLFTTDADSRPCADWIQRGIAALEIADVVAGRIVRMGASGDPAHSRVEAYYDRLHAYRRRIDPVPWEARDTHHFTGGANLAFRTGVYHRLGGFKALAFGEDARLLDDAARAGFRVRRDAALVVQTSSRRQGRAVQGLSSALRALDTGASPLLANPRAAAWQWREQAVARQAFDRIDRQEVRGTLGMRWHLPADHILGVARDCPNAEAFAMRVVPACADHADDVPLAMAEDMLALLESEGCEMAA